MRRWSPPALLAAYAAIGGALSFLGWAGDVHRLTDWFSNNVSIQPNTALAAFFAGIALLLLDGGYRKWAAVIGSFVALIGGSVIFQYLTGVDLGIDALFTFGRPWGMQVTSIPGRMGQPAATSWTIIGAALIVAATPLRTIVPAMASFSAIVSSLSLIGYLYGARALFAIPVATAISLQTATFILAMSLGIIASIKEYGPARMLMQQSTSGALLRRTLPALILIPMVLGWLRLAGQQAGFFSVEFGTAVRTVAEIVLLILLMWWVARDVDAQEEQRRIVEYELIAKERLLRTVTEEAQVGLVIVGKDHRYLYANRAYCEIVHVDPNGIIGRHPKDVLPDVYETRIRPKIDAALKGETVRYELELPERNQFVSVTYLPQYEGNVINSSIVAIVDTTERRKIEDNLRASRLELQEASRRKDEFLVMLAHELRNPLAPIRTAVEVLNRAPTEKDAAWARAVIDRQLTLMVRLLDDLLDVGRIARDKLTLRLEPLELSSAVRGTLEMNQALADQAKQTVHFSAPQEPIFVHADHARLQQVVANLLNNACRYGNPEGGRITVTVERRDSDAVVRIADTGIGIPSHELSRIFEMFSQLNRSADRSQGGLGIGLHLVQRLVQMHGGHIEARSEGPGHGSEFTFTLPTIPAPQLAATDASPSARSQGAIRTVLVVDDNADAADALGMLLKATGYESHVAYDGPSAIELADRVAPDIVLLDIGMPGMNGHDACRHIRDRAAAAGRQPLMVALTGWGQQADRDKSREAGFDHHVVKPVDFAALSELLQTSTKS